MAAADRSDLRKTPGQAAATAGASTPHLVLRFFVPVTSTIIGRSPVLPHILAMVGYAGGVVMLLSLSFLRWVVPLFPAYAGALKGEG